MYPNSGVAITPRLAQVASQLENIFVTAMRKIIISKTSAAHAIVFEISFVSTGGLNFGTNFRHTAGWF